MTIGKVDLGTMADGKIGSKQEYFELKWAIKRDLSAVDLENSTGEVDSLQRQVKKEKLQTALGELNSGKLSAETLQFLMGELTGKLSERGMLDLMLALRSGGMEVSAETLQAVKAGKKPVVAHAAYHPTKPETIVAYGQEFFCPDGKNNPCFAQPERHPIRQDFEVLGYTVSDVDCKEGKSYLMSSREKPAETEIAQPGDLFPEGQTAYFGQSMPKVDKVG
ncbi:MAG: hypothetical protein NT099_09190 [Candidatus Saganbacteria bacterium]|nr:hypothetical protein [Candidatus Saganbacteria bacterium]